MAGRDGQVAVQITGDVGELDAAMDRATASVQRAAVSMEASTAKISGAFEGMAHRFEHSGVMIAFAVNNMMDGTQTGVERALHSIALLGFAFDPVVGSITTALALIADTIKNKLKDATKELDDFNKKMEESVNSGNVAALMKRKEELLTGLPMKDGKLVGKSELVPGAFKGSLEDLEAEAKKANTSFSALGMGIKMAFGMAGGPESPLAKAREELAAINAALDAAGAQRERLTQGGDLPKVTITATSDKRAAEDAAKAAKDKLDLQMAFNRLAEKSDEDFDKMKKKLLDDDVRASGEALHKKIEAQDKAEHEWFEVASEAQRFMVENAKQSAERVAKASQESARLTEEGYLHAFDGIQSGFERAMEAMKQHGGNFAMFMRKVGQELLGDFVRNELKMLEAHAAVALAKSTIDSDGAAKSKAIVLAENLSKITAHAADAAASVYSGTVEFLAPIMGPLAMAPAAVAAGAAFAAVEAFGAMASAAGGFDVPAGINPVTQLHAQEMVLPASLANAVRSGAGGLGGGQVHVHIHALDSADVHAWARKNTEVIGKAALTHMQRGGALPTAAGRRA